MNSEKPEVSQYVRYLSIREKSNKRVILPAVVATHCKLFSELFSALYATELHVQGTSDGLFTEAPLETTESQKKRPRTVVAASVAEDADNEEDYVCCCGPCPSSLPLTSSSSGEGNSPTAEKRKEEEPVLEVQLPCLEYETLARMAEFVVRKTVMTDGPAEAAGVSVLRDLDSPSGENQYKAVQLLLGSDFLGC